MSLFKQDPSKSEQYKPDSVTRRIESLDIERKADLNKFKNWMVGATKVGAELPDKKELDKLHDEATKRDNSKNGIGILGAVAAMAGGGFAFHSLGGIDGVSSMLGDATSFITGGGNNSTGGGSGMFGISGLNIESLTPKMPDFSGLWNNITGQSSAQSQSSPELPELPTVTAPPTAVVTSGSLRTTEPSEAASQMAKVVKELREQGLNVVAVPPQSGDVSSTPVRMAAEASGATTETGEYALGELTPESVEAIRQKYPNAPQVDVGNTDELRKLLDHVKGLQNVPGGSALPQSQAQPMRSPATVTPTQSAAPGPIGNVNQWIHGNPNRAGYRADHGGLNAHDHFSFNSRASAVAAYKALKDAGYAPYEFEGYGDGLIYGHSETGGHYGPVGGPYTPDDPSDGTAFDIPWSSYGSGPITQSDYDKSYKAAQIVGAVGGGGASVTQAPSSQPPNHGEGRTEQPQQQQQQGPGFVQQMTKLLGPLADVIMPYINGAMDAFAKINDKEYMDSIHIYGRDPETGLPTNTKPASQESEYDLEYFLNMVESVPKDTNVSMFIPEAELAQSGMTIVLNDNQTLVQSTMPPSTQVPESSGGTTRSSGDVIVLGGPGGRHTYNRLMYTKLF